MTPEEQIDTAIGEYRVKFVAKRDSKLMTLISWLLFWIRPRFINYYWTTIRFPFRDPRVNYPAHVADPFLPMFDGVMGHEILYHAKSFRPWWGPWFWIPMYLIFPLPIFFSGRWYFERWAKLYDIKRLIEINGWSRHQAIEQIVNGLWNDYGWCWPRPWMREFFEAQLDAS